MQKKRSLIEIIDQYISSGKAQLPVMNHNSIKIQKEIAKSDPDLERVMGLVKKDVSLTSEVLKLANSPFYKGLEEVKTVQEAVIRLGMTEVTNIVLLTSQKSTFRSKDSAIQESMNQLWIHSVGCAVGAQWLAKQTHYPNLNEAFLAGLLHNVGAFLLLYVMDQIKEKNAVFPKALMDEVITKMHPKYGHLLLKTWNLPEKYCTIANDHHALEFNEADLLLVIIRLADKMCEHLKIGLSQDREIDIYSSDEAAVLDLNDVILAQMEIKLEDALHLA